MRVMGQEEVVRRLKLIRDRAPELFNSPEAKDLLVKRIKGRFMQGVSPTGAPWPNLLPETVKKKKRKGSPKPEQILYDTGKMYEAIKAIRGSNAGTFAINTGLGFRIGIDDPDRVDVGRVHNYGRGRPLRQFLGVNANDVRSFSRFVQKRMDAMLRSMSDG